MVGIEIDAKILSGLYLIIETLRCFGAVLANGLVYLLGKESNLLFFVKLLQSFLLKCFLKLLQGFLLFRSRYKVNGKLSVIL